METPLTLDALLTRLRKAGLSPQARGRFDRQTARSIAHDSRAVEPGTLFVAIRGEHADGHLFIDKAVKNGAIAIVCEAMPENADTRFPGIAFAQVANARAALAELAAAWYGDPGTTLRMVGVTGTNGKTTTSFLLHHALTRLGAQAGLIGTIEVRIGDRRVASEMTTPDGLAVQALLAEMVRAGCTACAMEVSSHALAQSRVRPSEYDVAIFSNLTRDHLDYHRTFEDYQAAKQRLFDGLGPDATALTNLDDEAGRTMVAGTRARVVTYGRVGEVDLRLEILENRLDGLRLRLDGRERTFRLVGQFNAYNLAAAYGALVALGYRPEAALDALAGAPPVPGRFEQLRFGERSVIVDYAHTPDALENVLRTIRDTKAEAGALWCVFGCGGDRDPSKRRVMGAIAERLAEHVVVTSDNPRTEDPEAIMNDIRRGMDRPNEAEWIVDRREALEFVAARSGPGDVILVAGKGHEPYQIVGTERRHFDDREEVRKIFEIHPSAGG